LFGLRPMYPELAGFEELLDIVPGAPLRRSNRNRFIQALALRASNDTTKSWVCRVIGSAAYDMPLPPRWSEQVDNRGYIYFAHVLRSEATWDHPLLDAFRQTLDFALSAGDAKMSLADAVEAVKSHLLKVQSRAASELQVWRGPFRESRFSNEYFYNVFTEASTWESPVERWQYELHARYWLLVQLLQQVHMAQEQAASGVQPPGLVVDSSAGAELTRLPSKDAKSATFEISPVVKAHASDIASTLASAAKESKIAMPKAIRFDTTDRDAEPLILPPDATAPVQRLPPSPKKSPPPLRHLPAPPRIAEQPPEHALHTDSPGWYVGDVKPEAYKPEASSPPRPRPAPPPEPKAGTPLRYAVPSPSRQVVDAEASPPEPPESSPTPAARALFQEKSDFLAETPLSPCSPYSQPDLIRSQTSEHMRQAMKQTLESTGPRPDRNRSACIPEEDVGVNNTADSGKSDSRKKSCTIS